MKSLPSAAFALGTALLLSPASLFAQELVINGDFSSYQAHGNRPTTYTFSNWSTQGPFIGLASGYNTPNAAYLGAGWDDNGAIGDRFTQTIPTEPGITYTLSFYLIGTGGSGTPGTSSSSNVYVDWDGNRILSLDNASFGTWTRQSFAVTASGSTTTFDFGSYSPGSYNISTVSVVVPEPSTYVLVNALVLGGILAWRRKLS